ncbi:MAG: rhomboid family intramembrane serine protease, partial [Bacteroidota bacterium]
MHDQYRPRRFSFLPEVVKNLLIINGILFLAAVVLEQRGIDLNDILGLHYFESEKFRWWQFFTYMFMHGSIAHIISNMLPLWMFGSTLENTWGGKKFLNFYIICGLGAALTHSAIVYIEMKPAIDYMDAYIAVPDYEKLKDFTHSVAFTKFSSAELAAHYNDFSEKFNLKVNEDFPAAIALSVDYMKMFRADVLNAPVVVGASGSVFGLLLAFGMLFPNNLLYLYFAFPIKAKYFVIGYGLFELFGGIANVPGDNIAHFAHLGGLLFGFITIMYW